MSPRGAEGGDGAGDAASPAARRQALLVHALGWVAGGVAGLVANYLVYRLAGQAGFRAYPIEPTTFVAVALGAFGGVRLAGGLGRRAAPILAGALGVLLAVAVALLAG